MSHNVGGLFIKPRKDITTTVVVKAITASWIARGAKVDKRDPKKLAALGLETSNRLGYAIADAGGWIVVAESERYTFDHRVAADVAKALGTECLWYVLYGATDAGSAQRWGKKPAVVSEYGEVEELVEELPLACEHYDAFDDATFVALKDVEPSAYDHGPIEEEAPKDPPAKAPKLARNATKAPFTPVRVRNGKDLMLRDAFVLAFFLDGSISKTRKALAAAIDSYVAFVPPDVLRWSLIGYSSTTVRAFNSGTIARAKADLAKKDSFLWLGSDDEPETGKPQKDEPHASAYLLRASGHPDPISLLELRFASDFVWQVGVDAFVAFVVELASKLPIVSGYGSLGLAMHPMITSFTGEQWAAAMPLAKEHPGWDLSTNDSTDSEIAGRCRGARWLTILGPALAKRVKLAGLETIKAGTNVVIRADKEPSPDPDQKRYGAVAKALVPVTLFDEKFLGAYFAHPTTGERDPVAFASWEFRFLGGIDGAIAHLAAAKDRESAEQLLAIRIEQKNYKEAQKLIALVAKRGAKDKDLGTPLVALSKLAEDAGRGSEAISWFTRWHEATAENRWTLYRLGQLHETYGDKAEAKRLMARYDKLTAAM